MIQINNLNFSYGLKHTLNSINLNFDGSQIISLVGPNGCGKSTLLKCMCRILATPNNSIIIDFGKIDRICATTSLFKHVYFGH